MANKYHGNLPANPSRGSKANTRRPGASASVNEKPGFPSAKLPGKTQSKNRSGGVHGCKTYADKKGL